MKDSARSLPGRPAPAEKPGSGADLAMAGGAFDWVLDHLAEFDPYPKDGEPNDLRAKAAAELALMCASCLRVPELASDHRLKRFVDAMSDVMRRPVFNERIMGSPGEFTLIGGTYSALRACGFEDTAYHAQVQRLVDKGHPLAAERVPCRMLDLRFILDLGEFRHSMPSYSELYRATPLAMELEAAFIDIPEAYSVTHTVFFITQFGAGSPDSIPAEELPGVQWLVTMLLGLYARERHWDLVGELLLCCSFLNWRPPLIYDEAWTAFWAAQQPDGAVPGASLLARACCRA